MTCSKFAHFWAIIWSQIFLSLCTATEGRAQNGSHLEKLLEKEEGVDVEATVAEAFREKLLSPAHGGTHASRWKQNQDRKTHLKWTTPRQAAMVAWLILEHVGVMKVMPASLHLWFIEDKFKMRKGPIPGAASSPRREGGHPSPAITRAHC